MKGVIIAAGYGTRFLPVTKTVPKEMLPLVDVPSIKFIIDEFVSSGIRDILVISSRRKKVLEDFLDREVELEAALKAEGKDALLEKIVPPDVNVFFMRQREMLGTGHALMLAESFTGNEPFVVAYPDDLHFGKKPLAGQLIERYKKTGCCVMASIYNPPNLSRYGVLKIENNRVVDMVEKPAAGTEPGRDASIGRYLYTPDIFPLLREGWEKHTGGEYYHLYALKKLMTAGRVVNHSIEGERIDTGEPSGYLLAILKYAETRKELLPILKDWAETFLDSHGT
ncbi:UTP--glucose-1-phosphate uridylyltransferase [Spirochaetia bacterium 38H-sp]|uniref:UTP--glucose-1-phosphate uridylyltransferase n=1 Tax=Rarispira pelagica TaxID=3141764 RepID=A0ABU9U9E1_9SPIR